MNFGIYPTLTKDYILQRITQEQIMEYYLGISVVFDTLICSPLRTDHTPTCTFYYNKYGRLRFRDFSGHFWGDCFDVVARGLRVETNTKNGFKLILHTIAKDFKIHQYEHSTAITKYNLVVDNILKKQKYKNPLKFKVIFREYNYHDTAYWSKYNINEDLLNYGKVFFAQEIHISKDNLPFKHIYSYKPSDPVYCYYGGRFPNNVIKWRFYFPFRKQRGENGFISNASFLQGKHMITCDRFGGITKSYKDVLAFKSIGIQTVAPSAESILLTQDEYWFMNSHFDYLFSTMDYGTKNKLDRAGMSMAKKLRDIYRIDPIMLTNGMFGSENFEGKDVSDFIEIEGVKAFKSIVRDLIGKYKSEIRIQDIQLYNYLKNIK